MFDEIHTHFQAIVGLRTGETFAYEAYSRGPSDEGLFDPRSLFMAAVEQARLVELDIRCMDVAIERGVEQGLLTPGSPSLFVNTLPDTLHSSGFVRHLEEALDRAGADPEGLVLEVNEGWRIQDYRRVRAVLDDLRSLGIRAAVDDAGAGHSGLQVLAELQPDFVKIDKALIRGVHADPGRSAILEMFVVLADRLDVALVAEGVEYPAELAVVAGMGIDYAQGYLIGRPGPTPSVDDAWEDAHRALPDRPDRVRPRARVASVGALATPAPTAQAHRPVRDVVGLFDDDPAGSLVVLDGEDIVGLVPRQRLFHVLADPLAADADTGGPIAGLADGEALVVDFAETVAAVARAAADRTAAAYDDVVVTREGQLHGTVEVRRLLAALAAEREGEGAA